MSLLNEILLELNREKSKGNTLIGSCGYSFDKPSFILDGPFVKAQQIFPKVKDLIEETEHELLIALYKFQADSDGAKQILAGLENLKKKAEKFRNKITVRILINKKVGLASLVRGDGRVSSLNLELPFLQSNKFFNIQIANHEHTLFDSSHSKMFISDNKEVVVLTGDPTFRNTMDERAWVEVGTLCRSPGIATDARKNFTALWNKSNVKLISKSQKKSDLTDVDCSVASLKESDKTILFLGKNPNKNPLVKLASPYKISLLKLLNAAKKSVQIMVNNINDPDILSAIVACANKGIKVQLIVGRYHGESAESLPFAGGTNKNSIAQLIRKVLPGKKKNLDLRWACNAKGRLVQNMCEETIHAKVAIIDGEYVITGSSLMDRQSLRSGESDFLFQSTELAKKYQSEAFYPTFNQGRSVDIKPLSRKEVVEFLKNAKFLPQVLKVLGDYILMREYEDEFHGVGFFQRKINRFADFRRDKKISDAEFLLSFLQGKVDKEDFNKEITHKKGLYNGLLGKIFETYLNIKNNKIEIELMTISSRQFSDMSSRMPR